MKPISISAAAKLLDVSHVALIKARKLGTFPGGAGEPVDLDEVITSEWGRRRGVTRESFAKAMMSDRNSEPVPRKQKSATSTGAGKLSELNKVDVDKLVGLERREKLRLQNEREKGTIVSTAEVEANWADIAVRIQTSVMGLPARIANRLPAEWRHEVMTVAQDEARQVLHSLSDEIRSDPEAA